MQFDRPEHKELCAKIVEATNFPGQILELALEFKRAVQNAAVGVPAEEVNK